MVRRSTIRDILREIREDEETITTQAGYETIARRQALQKHNVVHSLVRKVVRMIIDIMYVRCHARACFNSYADSSHSSLQV